MLSTELPECPCVNGILHGEGCTAASMLTSDDQQHVALHFQLAHVNI